MGGGGASWHQTLYMALTTTVNKGRNRYTRPPPNFTIAEYQMIQMTERTGEQPLRKWPEPKTSMGPGVSLGQPRQ